MIDASSAVLLVQFEVPFGILIAYFFLKERPSKKNLLGLIIAFIGVVIYPELQILWVKQWEFF